ncbi:MAG: type I-C CRISPR-associated protein Cas8c/Csd1 [Akkermansia sp.]
MFLQELYKLYQGLAQEEKVPLVGRSKQRVSFCLVLKQDGGFYLDDAREPNEKGKMTPIDATVLGDTKPPGAGINPCFLWDNSCYMLSYDLTKPERAPLCFAAGKDKYLEVEQSIGDEDYSLFCRFLDQWNPDEQAEHLAALDYLTHNGLVRIQGKSGYLHQNPAIISWWESGGREQWKGVSGKARDVEMGQCLITGQHTALARLHEPAIKGVPGAQPGGAKIVSFDKKAFQSYAKDQSYNAPVSESAAFAYCNALNYLLSSSSNRMRIGDATLVFWSGSQEKADDATLLFRAMMDPDMADAGADAQQDDINKRVRHSLGLLAQGRCPQDVLDDADSPFYILALSGNVARLSVRFYLQSSLGELVAKIQQHQLDMDLQKRSPQFKDPNTISPFRILRETVRDSKDIPPLFSGALMRAILNGSPYPDVIAQAIIRRMRVDYFINYVRCSFLKAWIIRRNPKQHITTMLDAQNQEIGYVLGRLFAVLQKTQEDALPGLNRSLRESFYASASASPKRVFPRLLKLFTHHVAKLEGGRKVNRDKLMQEVFSLLDPAVGYPAQLSLEQQGLFSIGFYHQTQAFYEKKTDVNTES